MVFIISNRNASMLPKAVYALKFVGYVVSYFLVGFQTSLNLWYYHANSGNLFSLIKEEIP